MPTSTPNVKVEEIAEALEELAGDLEDEAQSLRDDETPSNCGNVAENLRGIIQSLQLHTKDLDKVGDPDGEINSDDGEEE